MKAHVLDLSAYPRRAHFDYFRAMANPYAGVTVPVDLTDWMRRRRAQDLPFFLTFLHAVLQAANAVPELRRRIRGDQIVEYDCCPASYTVALPDGTYCYCTADGGLPLARFLPLAQARQAEAVRRGVLAEDEDSEACFFVSCLPWLSYTALLQPTPSPADSNPRITWGKYTEERGRIHMPVTLLVHHALADGLHIARFYDGLNEALSMGIR